MSRGLLCCLGSFFLLCLGGARLLAADWPQFRGPTGQGISEGTGLAVSWSETENITWKKAIPGHGWSSPVVEGGQLWLTAATDGGRSLRAIAVDPESGEIFHDIEVFRQDEPSKKHRKNSHATPTPILEDDRVYVHFGHQGTAALKDNGEILWRNRELRYEPGHGQGGTPALSRDLLIISCDGTDRQFVVALDKNTGKVRWNTPRTDAAMAFSTPLVIEHDGAPQVVSPGANRAVSYDLETGRELWSIRYGGFSNVPRPVYSHGLVFLSSGYYNPALYAIRPDGRGDVTATHVIWKMNRGVPLTPSPVVVGDEMYFVSDKGIASCVDAKTGEPHWRARMTGAYSASPLYAEGHIYFQNETGLTTVITPGRTFNKVAENQLDGRTFASIATVGKAMFLRTDTHLYRIEN